MILCLLLPTLSAGAQERVRLDECIRRALENNYSLKITRNDEKKASNDVNYSPFLPSLNGTGSQNQNVYQTEQVASDLHTDRRNVQDQYAAGVQLQWTLFDGFAMFADHSRVKEFLQVGELRTKWAVESLIVQVSELYYAVIVEQSKLQAAAHTLSLSNDRYTEARDKYNLGILSGLEMQQARIDLNADSSSYMRQREYLKSAYIALNKSMTENLQDTGYVNDTITLLQPLTLPVLEERTVADNTQLHIARRQTRISELDLKIARSALFPSLNFNTGYNYSRTESPASSVSLNQYHGPYWGFSVRVPLFNKLDTNRKIRNAKLDIENSMLSYKDAELQLMGDLAQLYNTYENNLRIVEFENVSAEVAFENLDAALQKYKIGSLSGIEFREFQRSYIDAVNRKLSAIYQAKVSELSLLLISGGITPM